MKSELQHISYGTTEIEYSLSFSPRKTLQIAVYPDKTVGVVAPDDAPLDKIQKKVRKRASWILKQIRYFSRFREQKSDFEYVSGETHKYLGKQYRLKVISASQKESVKLRGGYIIVESDEKSDPVRTEELVKAWYRKRAEIKFEERIDLCMEFLKPYQLPKPTFKIQRMEKRWGSYTPSGSILLNPELIKYPSYCIDYVIIHEMCHVKYNHHDKDFYNLLATILPDWEYRKRRLEEID